MLLQVHQGADQWRRAPGGDFLLSVSAHALITDHDQLILARHRGTDARRLLPLGGDRPTLARGQGHEGYLSLPIPAFLWRARARLPKPDQPLPLPPGRSKPNAVSSRWVVAGGAAKAVRAATSVPAYSLCVKRKVLWIPLVIGQARCRVPNEEHPRLSGGRCTGALSADLRFPLPDYKQRLVTVGQTGAPPNLSTLGAGKDRHPIASTMWSMDRRLRQARLPQGYVAQQNLDDPPGGDEERRSRLACPPVGPTGHAVAPLGTRTVLSTTGRGNRQGRSGRGLAAGRPTSP